MTKVLGEYGQQFYPAAQRFVDNALRRDDSLFTPGVAIWTEAHLAELQQRLKITSNKVEEIPFLEKFSQDLKNAQPAIYQLVGELLYVHLLIANSGITSAVKRNLINTVLSWSPKPVKIPADLDAALDFGVAKVGVVFTTARTYNVAFLLDTVLAWKRLFPNVQSNLLKDPWAFKQFVFSQPIFQAYVQREALLHLVHPDTFEPIVSREDKNKFAQQYKHYATNDANDVDELLFSIQQGYQQQFNRPLNYYNPEDTSVSAPIHAARMNQLPSSLGRLLRNYAKLAIRIDKEITAQELLIILGRIQPAIVAQRPNENQLLQDLLQLRVLEQVSELRYRRWSFLDGASEEQMMRYMALTLLVPRDNGYELPLLRAPLDSQAHPVEAWPYGKDLLDWYVEAGLVQADGDLWRSADDALTPPAGTSIIEQTLQQFLDLFKRAKVSQEQRGNNSVNQHLPFVDPDLLKERIAELQAELLVDTNTILRIYRALLAGQHVILSGPPGTGKTHLARKLPSLLWADSTETVELTLHTNPAESPLEELAQRSFKRMGYDVYVVTATEDWGVRQVMGGIVPQIAHSANGQQLIYKIRLGVLSQTVLENYKRSGDGIPSEFVRQEIRTDDGTRYHGRWLVIDEFTRAPIDAAFGSLLTTLGSSGSPLAIPTEDGGEALVPFPKDFRIIGTLNSFDRHFLNQISEAMKRRFIFIDVLPPSRDLRQAEESLSLERALSDLRKINPELETFIDAQTVRVDDTLTLRDSSAQAVLTSFWNMYWAIRNYRQLGTAQANTLIQTLFTGVAVGMTWPQALDSALADVLADQLQVLARDEQRTLLAYIRYADQPERFVESVRAILNEVPAQRRRLHLNQLQLEDNDQKRLVDLHDLSKVFDLTMKLSIEANGVFAKRLEAFINERGL
jgi:5-methylcytosine-specific restriction protein B